MYKESENILYMCVKSKHGLNTYFRVKYKNKNIKMIYRLLELSATPEIKQKPSIQGFEASCGISR